MVVHHLMRHISMKDKLMENMRKLYCPKLNEGEHCPLCEAREALLMEGSKKG